MPQRAWGLAESIILWITLGKVGQRDTPSAGVPARGEVLGAVDPDVAVG